MEYEQKHTIIVRNNARCVWFSMALTTISNWKYSKRTASSDEKHLAFDGITQMYKYTHKRHEDVRKAKRRWREKGTECE